MSTINSGTFAIEKKNQQQLKKFVSIISNYEQSLNKKVDDLVSHMINYSKKVQDPVKLPQIRVPKSAGERSKSLSKTIHERKENSRIYNRQKSISSTLSFISQINQNMEEKINTLKKSTAQSLMQQNMNMLPQGRAIGTKRFVKPKYVKRQADVVPREVRLDPFAQKNVIKAQDLDKGIMALIERGKIGKDVDIITAFQKGGEVLNAKQAIFHHGEQRVTRMQPIKPVPKRQPQDNMTTSNIAPKKLTLDYEQNDWAITMPEQDFTTRGNVRKAIDLQQQTQRAQLNLETTIHLKFVHYQPVRNHQFHKFVIKHLEIQGELSSIFSSLGQLLQKYCIQVAFVDSSRVLDLSTIVKKISESQLIACILSFKDQPHIKIRQIVNISQRKHTAICKLQALCKMLKQRRIFTRYLKIKKVQTRIGNWLYNVHVSRSFKQRLVTYKQQVVTKFQSLQHQFRQSFLSIQNQKHYEIHISNKSFQGKTVYKEFLNTQITRIFNFQNPKTHIIIILSQALTEETKNYYYKIMELQEIPNFRDKVTFLHVRQHHIFARNKLNTSQKLYYDSQLMREVKRRIDDCPAYFRISYPSQTDVSMAVHSGIPILTGDLVKLMQVERRSQSIEHFGLPQLAAFRMKPNEYKPLTLASALSSFCQKHKRHKNYVIKVNGSYQSRGIGLLTYPFSSLPEIYSNTAFIINTENPSPSQFYRKLCKHGGIIQAFEQSLSSVVIMGKLSPDGAAQLTATFDKISYGFVNVGYFFPQVTVPHNEILAIFNSVSGKLAQLGHFGDFQICLFVDENYTVYLDKVQCYQTEIGSSLFYFKFLCHGNLNNKGQYITKITETFQTDGHKEEELVTLQPRSYCYLPYILHFGLSEKQVGSFFQLCRMGGISFDLENKYGSTFILLGSLKNSMGMITTAKDRETCKKLMIKSLDFIIKQNAHNNSSSFVQEKEIRMRERENILALKERLEDL